MMKEQFTEAMEYALQSHRERCSCVQPKDIVKFIFQGFLGMGHLLGEPDQVEKRIANEMHLVQPSREENLTENLSPAWCRLNLRRAKSEGLTPQIISGMMYMSGSPAGYTMEDVIELCRSLAEKENNPDILKEALLLRKTHSLPLHSEAYRQAHRPAYRVISTEWCDLLPALCAISNKMAGTARFLVTIDGPCASGKTTLARKLADVLGGDVIHTDDFVVSHNRKTPERLTVPGGNCDWERLVRDVIEPWKNGAAVRYQRYDCHADLLKPYEPVMAENIMILEGCYCNLPAIREYADFRIFLETPEPIRCERLKRRESPASLLQFYSRWIPLENAYFTAYDLPDPACFILQPTISSM